MIIPLDSMWKDSLAQSNNSRKKNSSCYWLKSGKECGSNVTSCLLWRSVAWWHKNTWEGDGEESCLMTQKHLRGRRGGALLNDTKTAERETGRRVAWWHKNSWGLETNRLLIVTFAFSLQENHGLYEICWNVGHCGYHRFRIKKIFHTALDLRTA